LKKRKSEDWDKPVKESARKGGKAKESYGFKVVAKNRRFTQQNITVNDEINDLNFIAEP
jgi:hypothetical protein